MEQNFYIEKIKNDDDLNALSIALNELDAVSRIKIHKNSITFTCYDSSNLQMIIQGIDESLEIKELVYSKKNIYRDINEKKEQIFLFTNLKTQEEADQIALVISKYKAYEDVHIDFNNKILTLTTSQQNVLKRLNRLVDKVNVEIDVEQWKKPFKSQDLFTEKYAKRYFRISLLLLGIALGLVTHEDPSFISRLGWFIGIFGFSDRLLSDVKNDLKEKRYFSENCMFLVALVLGWGYGAYFETLLICIFYRCNQFGLSYMISKFMKKIDQIIQLPQSARILDSNGELVMQNLNDFDIGDTMVIFPGETIPLGGNVIQGESQIDTFAVDGNELPQTTKVGQEVYSGSKCIDGQLYIEVSGTYEISAFSKIMNIAAHSPTTESFLQKCIRQATKYLTIFIRLASLGLIVYAIYYGQQTLYYELYFAAILLSISGHSVYEQIVSFTTLAGVAKAFTKGIMIKENSGLNSIYQYQTLVYDRFDMIEVTQEEMDMFKQIEKFNKKLIIFNDGPVALENDQFTIYNDLTNQEKLQIIKEIQQTEKVIYIGDSSKDIDLLQQANVAIARGSLHHKKVVDHSDILLIDSNFETIIKMLKLAKKQSHITIMNMIILFTVVSIITIFASVGINGWLYNYVLFTVFGYLLLLNSYRIIK